MTGDAHKAGQTAAVPQADDLPAGLRRATDLSQLRDVRLTRTLTWWQGLRESLIIGICASCCRSRIALRPAAARCPPCAKTPTASR